MNLSKRPLPTPPEHSTNRQPTASSRLNNAGLSRDIELLEILAGDHSNRSGGLGVSEIAQLTRRSKTVVSRALATLTSAGLASRDSSSGRFSVGPRVFALAARTAEAHLVRLSRAILRDLVQTTQETAHLCVLRHGNVLTLASELSPHELRSAGWEGVTTAAWRTSSGRALISDWDVESLQKWYEAHGNDESVIDRRSFDREANPFSLLESPPTHDSIVNDFDSLRKELSRIRNDGYATIRQEFEAGVIGVSSPVRDHTGRIVAALNVSGPSSRIESKVDALGQILRRSSSKLSQTIGLRA